MKPYILLTCILMTTTACLSQVTSVDPKLKLWYDQPAKVWEEALPLGNGKSGAMVFGGVNTARFQLNNNTLWSGIPNPGNNAKGPEALPKVRQAVFDGRYEEAAEIWKKNLQGPYSARYLTMADLFLNFNLKDSTTTFYRRELDLNNAVHTVTYKVGGVTYKRETIVSYPDKVSIIRITADKRNSINLTTGITSKLRYSTTAVQSNYLVLKGKAPKHVAHRASEPQQIVYDDNLKGEGMTFEVHVQVKAEGGSTKSSGDKIDVTDANAVTIYLTNGTSFNGVNKSPGLEGKDPSIEAKANMKNASAKSYASIEAAHIADYKKLFNRVSFNLASILINKLRIIPCKNPFSIKIFPISQETNIHYNLKIYKIYNYGLIIIWIYILIKFKIANIKIFNFK